MDDAARRRFAASAGRMAGQTERGTAALTERLRDFARLSGPERALDAGTGTGTFALALAPAVREVVGLDPVPELLEHARRLAGAASNVEFVEGDATALPFPDASFDVAACSRTLHHVAHPDLVLVELGRVLRPGGRLVLVDQLAAPDPREAEERDRIERLRDPAHERTLSEQEIRQLIGSAGLELERVETVAEERDLDRFLDLAACEGEPRRAVLAEVERLVEAGHSAGIDLRRSEAGYALTVAVGWFLAVRPRAT